MSWGIADTAPEIEKIKAESADYLHGLDSCGVIDWDTYNYAFDFYMDLLNRAYEQGKKDTSSEWIPVSERLPSEKGHYLVTYRLVLYGDVLDSEDKVGFDTFRGKTSWAKKEHHRVIAWRSIPKPYHKDFEDIELHS